MSKDTDNLCDCPTFKLDDRRAIAERCLKALLADPDCRNELKGTWRAMTADEEANWESRQFFVAVIASYPVKEPDVQPPAEVEPPRTDLVDDAPKTALSEADA